MDLNFLANSAITSVNPNITATLKQSTGYTTSSSGKRTPAYATTTGDIQVQGMSAQDLKHTDGLNLSGVLRHVWFEGDWESVVRKGAKGGDLMIFDGDTWLVVHVMETWADWSSVIIQLQVDA
jgi:hypothetical protein